MGRKLGSLKAQSLRLLVRALLSGASCSTESACSALTSALEAQAWGVVRKLSSSYGRERPERMASMWAKPFVFMLATEHDSRLPHCIAMESPLAGRTTRLRTDLITAAMARRCGSP